VLSRLQLFEAGLNAESVKYRLKIGRLQLVHRNVYGVGHAPISPIARAMAAVLACGPGAVLSHRSAATLWGIDSRWRTPVEVTARGARSIAGVQVHRSRTLEAPHIKRHLGIPVTSPARTVLDLADVLDDGARARAVNEAQVIGRLRLADLATLLSGARGRHGRARLRHFVDEDGPPTRSAFEDAFLAFGERHGLPRSEVNRRSRATRWTFCGGPSA
jgi:hypothetical protein